MVSGVNVCIPTVGESSLLRDLLVDLLIDVEVARIDLHVNEPDKIEEICAIAAEVDSTGVLVKVIPAPEEEFYPIWNAALNTAQEEGRLVAILNDDIRFPGASPISRALSLWGQDAAKGVAVMGFDCDGTVPATPGVVLCSGTYRHGGVPGFAFIADPERTARVDERFRIWYGDDDLMFTTERVLGHRVAKCAVAVGHEESTTLHRRRWPMPAIEMDRAYWQEKWGTL